MKKYLNEILIVLLFGAVVCIMWFRTEQIKNQISDEINLCFSGKDIEIPTDLRSKLVQVSQDATKEQFAALEKKIVETMLSSFEKEKQIKSDSFLKAARESNDIEQKNTFYLLALEYAPHKKNLLDEYVNFSTEIISKSEYVLAVKKLSDLANIISDQLINGDVNDLKSREEFDSKLIPVFAKVNEEREKVEFTENEYLTNIEQTVTTLKTVAECEQAISNLQSKNFLSDSEDKVSNLLDKISAWSSCVTNPDEEFLLLPSEYTDYYSTWVSNFLNRLKSENQISEKKFADIAKASDLMVKIRNANESILSEVDTVISNLYIDNWNRRAAEVVLQEKSPKKIQLAASLLEEANMFNSIKIELIKTNLAQLNKITTESMIDSLTKSLQQIKVSDQLSARDRMQSLSGIQNQYIALKVQMMDIENHLENDLFAKEKKYVNIQNEIISKELESLRNIMQKEYLEIQRQALEKYKNFVRNTIESSDKLYSEADNISVRWGNKDVQKKLWEAWEGIVKVHPEDLNSVDPELFRNWELSKSNIEKHLEWDSELKKRKRASIEYKRLSDFFAE